MPRVDESSGVVVTENANQNLQNFQMVLHTKGTVPMLAQNMDIN
jgi:hypothetical protein